MNAFTTPFTAPIDNWHVRARDAYSCLQGFHLHSQSLRVLVHRRIYIRSLKFSLRLRWVFTNITIATVALLGPPP